jgi:hypothetical protein
MDVMNTRFVKGDTGDRFTPVFNPVLNGFGTLSPQM